MSEERTPSFENASGFVSNAYENVTDSISNLKNTVSNTMNEYSSAATVGTSSTDFLQSNSIIARITFVFLVIIVFVILLRLGMFLLGFFSQPSTDPYLIKGLISGSTSVQVKQDPKDSTSVPILRSNNQPTGLEFSWSTWLYISDLKTIVPEDKSGVNPKYQHIFHKGTQSFNPNGIASVNNAPGVYLSSDNTPTLRIIMDTVVSSDSSDQMIDITNVPLQKWFHLLVRMQNKSMDAYINGVVTAHLILPNVPKQNYHDIFVCQNGGFSGNLSNLRYYDSALNVFQINAIVAAGPNLTPSTSPTVRKSSGDKLPSYGFSYLSNMWYADKL